MDNLAHSLVGLAAAKAGLEKLSPGATAVCIIAANAPDLDFLSAISGDRWMVLHYHRGISHSVLGTLLLGVAIPTLFCVIERVASWSRRRPPHFRFAGLLLASLIACATHPLLDWTNNYGVRPFLPWSDRWFYGDLVFVVDPVLWLVFGAAAFLLTSKSRRQVSLWGLLAATLTILFAYVAIVGRGLDHPVVALSAWIVALLAIFYCFRIDLGKRFGSKIAITAFLTLLAYWGGLGLLHSKALTAAADQAQTLVAGKNETIVKLAAMPTPTNPAHWRCVVETDKAAYRFEVYLRHPKVDAKDVLRYAKPDGAEADIVALAAKDRRAQAFFEFARFPVEKVIGAGCGAQTLVQFADLRYTEPGKSRGNFSLELPVECTPTDVRTDGR
ncbi:MAG: metal-dependent hydrolase [Acidobacteriota bacterium]|nr:metal-dependent hydrolase [Acidobacteriota bacterium]